MPLDRGLLVIRQGLARQPVPATLVEEIACEQRGIRWCVQDRVHLVVEPRPGPHDLVAPGDQPSHPFGSRVRGPYLGQITRRVASVPAPTLSVFTCACAIALTCNGLAITTRFTKGVSTRDTDMQLPVASITTSSVASRLLPKPSSAVRVISIRPAHRSLPPSQKTTSPKAR